MTNGKLLGVTSDLQVCRRSDDCKHDASHQTDRERNVLLHAKSRRGVARSSDVNAGSYLGRVADIHLRLRGEGPCSHGARLPRSRALKNVAGIRSRFE